MTDVLELFSYKKLIFFVNFLRKEMKFNSRLLQYFLIKTIYPKK